MANSQSTSRMVVKQVSSQMRCYEVDVVGLPGISVGSRCPRLLADRSCCRVAPSQPLASMATAADTVYGERSTLSSVRLETARYSRVAKTAFPVVSSWELAKCTERRAAMAPRIHKPPLIFLPTGTQEAAALSQDIRA